MIYAETVQTSDNPFGYCSDFSVIKKRKSLKISKIVPEDSKIFRCFPLESPNRPAISASDKSSSKAEYAVNTFNFFFKVSHKPTTLMVSTMSADLASLPLLHEPKVSTAPRALMVFTFCATLKVLRLLARHTSPYTLARSKVLHYTKLPLNLAIVR